jgi:hypothetical protein
MYPLLLLLFDGRGDAPYLHCSRCSRARHWASSLTEAGATPILSSDGMTVYDTVGGVTWLQNGDLAANANYYFGVKPCSATKTSDCINQSGSMDYQAAKDWISGMNAADFLGHNNWQLPATPPTDGGCSGIGSQNDNFAFGCSGSAMGSLYYTTLGLSAANSAVPAVVGPLSGRNR